MLVWWTVQVHPATERPVVYPLYGFNDRFMLYGFVTSRSLLCTVRVHRIVLSAKVCSELGRSVW